MDPDRHLVQILLMIVLVSDIYCGRTSELYGFEGQEFTFTCPYGHQPFFWYKVNGTSERIGVASSLLHMQECHLPGCSISLETGDLTIPSISLSDEGWYTCKKSGSNTDFNNDDLHFVKVYVIVPPLRTSVAMTEIKYPVDGQPFSIECTVDRIKPRPEIFFKFTDTDQQYTGEETIQNQKDGALNVTSEIQKTFAHSDDGRIFRCVVQPLPGNGMKVVKDQVVHMNWEYSTNAGELD